jgi:hypothetical protein
MCFYLQTATAILAPRTANTIKTTVNLASKKKKKFSVTVQTTGNKIFLIINCCSLFIETHLKFANNKQVNLIAGAGSPPPFK